MKPIIAAAAVAACLSLAEPLRTPAPDARMREAAARMADAGRSALAPVYAPLAEHLVAAFDLSEKDGIGIDVGGGSGRLVIELARRTSRMYWINADINPYVVAPCISGAEAEGLGHRVGAIFADAQALPFKDGYADFIVSRGSFPFWEDKRLGFAEVWRVLRPGGVAYIGRGLSENLPVEVARKVREGQRSGPPPYEIDETRRELEGIMKALHISTYRIHTPKPPGSDGVNYGIWIEFRKPAARTAG
ncbi:MAG: class I SAM-dependent methyltransferase [Planctomycetes bacterium]|nr:class I SAM-dependent methyltransferase [Planctomycetota bacterium]